MQLAIETVLDVPIACISVGREKGEKLKLNDCRGREREREGGATLHSLELLVDKEW